jgi:hypothetical protein
LTGGPIYLSELRLRKWIVVDVVFSSTDKTSIVGTSVGDFGKTIPLDELVIKVQNHCTWQLIDQQGTKGTVEKATSWIARRTR